MKLHFGCSIRTISICLRRVLILLLLFYLVGCSDGNVNNPSAAGQADLEQLQEENEKLRKELEAALSNIEKNTVKEDEPKKEPEVEISQTEDEPEDQLNTPQEQPISEPEPIATQIDLVPPQREPEELVAGEWFYHNFHEEGFFSWIQSMVFYENGTGSMNRTYYVPKDDAESYLISLENIDVSLGCTWSLSGEDLHIVLETGESGEFTFLPDQQQLILKNGTDKYVRSKPDLLENYVERCLFAESGAIQAKKDMVKQSFLGTWYFDLLTWTFNEDGTGIMDIPAMANQPASTREFTYSITVDVEGITVTYVCLMIDWPDGRTSYFWPTMNNDGSVVLESETATGSVKLTRSFDIGNCPISTEIIGNAMGVFTGTIFDDILPGF